MKMKRIIALTLVLAILCSVPALAVSARAKRVVNVAIKQLGKPYSILSEPPRSYNCQTLVMYCYNQVKRNTLTAKGINTHYKKSRSTKGLQLGDIVCFKISSGRLPSVMNYHFGIYCGKGYFIHAQQDKGVTRSKVSKYDGKYLGAIRIF